MTETVTYYIIKDHPLNGRDTTTTDPLVAQKWSDRGYFVTATTTKRRA